MTNLFSSRIALLGLGAFALAAGALVPANAEAQRQRFEERGDRPPLRSRGEPGVVAAADLAFAKAAREQGLWTAFREYAAPGAVIHTPAGPVVAAAFLTGRADPAEAVSWEPNTIWTSCDGTLAVTFGRLQNPDGQVGSYVTMWELQSGGGYKWTYDVGALDNPQPPPPLPDEIVEDGDTIIVPGLLSIDGKVADCVRRGEDRPAPPAYEIDAATSSDGAQSHDETLQWHWEHHENGDRIVIVDYLREGEWQQVLNFVIPASGE